MDPITKKEQEDRELSQIFNKLTNYKVYPERWENNGQLNVGSKIMQ